MTARPRPGGAVLAALLASAALPAAAEGLAVFFHPTDDPFQSTGCAIFLEQPELRVAEVVGHGGHPLGPFRWFASTAEIAAVRAALDLFVSRALPAADPVDWQANAPPFVRIVRSARAEHGLAAGQFDQPRLDLPGPVEHLFEAVLPDSICRRYLPPS